MSIGIKKTYYPSSMSDKEVSQELLARSKKVIAQGGFTNSKRDECFPENMRHVFSHSQQPYLFLGKEMYLDFVAGLGVYSYEIPQQQSLNLTFDHEYAEATASRMTAIEVHIAEMLQSMFPQFEKLRFLKTGSEACNAALRIARAHTGKSLVLSEGYHGWGDDFISLTEPGSGVPKREWMGKLTDPSDVTANCAAVIVEPVILDMSQERIDWIRRLREVCTRLNVVLIFDECVTGFRVPDLCIANYSGINPDILILGKAVGGGMPLSVIGGKAEIMDNPNYFVSSTFAAEAYSLFRCFKLLEAAMKNLKLDQLWAWGERFQKEFNTEFKEKHGIWLEGYGTRTAIQGDPYKIALFQQEAFKARMHFGPSVFLTEWHLELMDDILLRLKDVSTKMMSEKLIGEMPIKPFAQKVREQR